MTDEWDPALVERANRNRIERQRLRAEDPVLFDGVSAILFRLDPMRINFETNEDEYEPEVGAILPRLSEASSASDVASIVHDVFERWFDPVDVGPREHYEQVGREVWELYRSRSNLT